MYLLPTFSNIFSSETIGLIEAKFHVEPPWDRGTKICSNDPGHITKLATIPLYGKNHKKSSFLEPKGQWPWNWYVASGAQVLPSLLKWWIWVDLDLFYGKVKFGPLCIVWEKGKTMDFSETVIVCDVEVGWCSNLNDYMNLYEYQRSRSFIDLGPRSLKLNIVFFSLETAKRIEARFHLCPPWVGGMKVCSNGPGHRTNMAAMPIYLYTTNPFYVGN